MEKVKKEGIKSDKGFTMIELIIVIAILGILAAILVPSFTQMTRKSRLKADISTIKQFQTQMDLYVADHDGKYPTDAAAPDVGGSAPTGAVGEAAIIADVLKTENYLKESDIDTTGPILQTDLAIATYDADAGVEYFKLDISASSSNVKATAGKLSPKEKADMIGYEEEKKD